MFLVAVLLYFTIQKLQAVKRLPSGELPRRRAAEGKSSREGGRALSIHLTQAEKCSGLGKNPNSYLFHQGQCQTDLC